VTAYVVSANLKRRHLTFDQRTAIAAELKPFFAAEQAAIREKTQGRPSLTKLVASVPAVSKQRSRDVAAAMMGVGGRSVSNFERVQKADPKLAAQVKAGVVTASGRSTSGRPVRFLGLISAGF
jgi:hypothetical protein